MIVIIGGGIAGLSLGWELVQKKCAVTVLEAETVAHGASGAASAYLEPRLGQNAIRQTEWRALKLWPDWVKRMEESARMEIGFRERGQIRIATEKSSDWLEEDYRNRMREGWEAEKLNRAELLELEPHLGANALWGIMLGQVKWVNARRMCQALARAIEAHGGRIETGRRIAEIIEDKSAMVAIDEQGRRFEGDAIVLAAGTGISELKRAMPEKLADVTKPKSVRGVALIVPMEKCVRRHIKHFYGNMCPQIGAKGEKSLMVGTTYEEGEDSLRVEETIVKKLYRHAQTIMPWIDESLDAEIIAGLRSKIGDGQMKIGKSAAMPKLFYSLGHGGSGFLRAPAIAQDLAREILEG